MANKRVKALIRGVGGREYLSPRSPGTPLGQLVWWVGHLGSTVRWVKGQLAALGGLRDS